MAKPQFSTFNSQLSIKSYLCTNNATNTRIKNNITYQKDKQWANEIIVNEEHTRCFAKYVKDGIVTLHEIDLDTGRVKGSLTLEEHTFPKKIRIKGGFVYYTYKESLYSDENKRYLWKQPLPE
ncbi:MAG: hypothetical protein FWG84_10435 [Bacteroidales bacterium]|nr:hypothetical protein [Bacteroidales bacterium]